MRYAPSALIFAILLMPVAGSAAWEECAYSPQSRRLPGPSLPHRLVVVPFDDVDLLRINLHSFKGLIVECMAWHYEHVWNMQKHGEEMERHPNAPDRIGRDWARWLARELTAAGRLGEVHYQSWADLAEARDDPSAVVTATIYLPTSAKGPLRLEVRLLDEIDPHKTLWTRQYEVARRQKFGVMARMAPMATNEDVGKALSTAAADLLNALEAQR